MRQLNGVYTQFSNRRQRRVGHLFQGRYKAILVDRDAYLLELTRYVVLNPVRAGMVKSPGEWPWSSYNAMMGREASPRWLATDKILSQFGSNRLEAMQAKLKEESEDVNIPRAQRRPPAPSLDLIRGAHGERDRTIVVAYETGEYSYKHIADHFGVHFTTVGRIIRESRNEALARVAGEMKKP
jgi:DNA-directed RNA polymerase specialized sigma24 family protein